MPRVSQEQPRLQVGADEAVRKDEFRHLITLPETDVGPRILQAPEARAG